MGMKKKLNWSKMSSGGVSVWIDFSHREYKIVKGRIGYTAFHNREVLGGGLSLATAKKRCQDHIDNPSDEKPDWLADQILRREG